MNNIDSVRSEIYGYYDDILAGKDVKSLPEAIDKRVQESFDPEKYVFWKGRILCPEFRGTEYFVGKINEKMGLVEGDKNISLIAATADGTIRLFEDYAGHPKRDFMIGDNRLIYNGLTLRDIQGDSDLERGFNLLLNTLKNI